MGSDIKVGSKSVVFFDGVCNLCNGAVNFIIDRDTDNKYMFSSLQSGEAKELLTPKNINPDQLHSIILLDNDKIYSKSEAVLQIAKNLDSPWKYLYYFRFIPLSIRDFIYDIVARYRYSWFGKRDACRIPTPELKAKFLDS
jgi:predicted DCC family thiol-disulfide oxidoreductase YuxK